MTILKRYLVERGIKQTWLAEKCGIAQPTMCQIVNGDYLPNPELAARIEELTGIDARILLGIPKQPPQQENNPAA